MLLACPDGQAVDLSRWKVLIGGSALPEALAAAVELLDWYRARWEIELFFLVLKEGCRVERLQLADTDRLQTALALYMVIAWRINRLMRLGRTLPDLPADLLFEPTSGAPPSFSTRSPSRKRCRP